LITAHEEKAMEALPRDAALMLIGVQRGYWSQEEALVHEVEEELVVAEPVAVRRPGAGAAEQRCPNPQNARLRDPSDEFELPPGPYFPVNSSNFAFHRVCEVDPQEDAN